MITLSNPKLSDRLRPDIDATPWVIAKIEKLEQQLASAVARIEVMGEHGLNKQAEHQQQLAAREKQIVLLRDALLKISQVACSMSPEQKITNEALAAPDNLDQYILCERKPVGLTDGTDSGIMWLAAIEDDVELYRAREPKP